MALMPQLSTMRLQHPVTQASWQSTDFGQAACLLARRSRWRFCSSRGSSCVSSRSSLCLTLAWVPGSACSHGIMLLSEQNILRVQTQPSCSCLVCGMLVVCVSSRSSLCLALAWVPGRACSHELPQSQRADLLPSVQNNVGGMKKAELSLSWCWLQHSQHGAVQLRLCLTLAWMPGSACSHGNMLLAEHTRLGVQIQPSPSCLAVILCEYHFQAFSFSFLSCLRHACCLRFEPLQLVPRPGLGSWGCLVKSAAMVKRQSMVLCCCQYRPSSGA